MIFIWPCSSGPPFELSAVMRTRFATATAFITILGLPNALVAENQAANSASGPTTLTGEALDRITALGSDTTGMQRPSTDPQSTIGSGTGTDPQTASAAGASSAAGGYALTIGTTPASQGPSETGGGPVAGDPSPGQGQGGSSLDAGPPGGYSASAGTGLGPYCNCSDQQARPDYRDAVLSAGRLRGVTVDPGVVSAVRLRQVH
jgi:hypothetical protein